MHFDLLDAILEISDDRIRAVKQVSSAEEYLGDHFPGFPILPGVLMVETMTQAARRLLEHRDATAGTDDIRRYVLGGVKAFKYGAMVRPGEALEVDVTIKKTLDDGTVECRGTGRVRRAGAAEAEETAASGRFTMRRSNRA